MRTGLEKVRVLIDSFTIGAMRVPRGSVIKMPKIAVDYMVKSGSGERVVEKPAYERQDMTPEDPPKMVRKRGRPKKIT